MKKWFGLLTVVAVFSVQIGLAQSTNYSSVEVASGGQVLLGNYGGIGRSCAVEPLPTIEMPNPPKHGVVSVRTGTVMTNKAAGCPNLPVPVQTVAYHARSGYVGPDQVVFGVKRPNGVVDIYSISVTVKEAPATQASPPSTF